MLPRETSYTAKNLHPGVTYGFTVTAVGTSASTSAGEVQLTACGTPDDPRDVSATPSGSSVTVTWSAPVPRNCPATGYQVEHRANGDSGDYTVAEVGPDTFSHAIDSLADGDWDIRVRLVNPLGESGYTYSTATVSTALAAPAAPTGIAAALSGDRAVTVSWTAATGTAAAPVDGYTVKWSESPSGANPLTFDVAASKTSFKVPNLTAGQAYSFNVASRNDEHTTDGTAATATPCEADRPTSAAVTETQGTGGNTDGTLNISWTLPPVHCTLTGIELEYAAFNKDTQTPPMDTDNLPTDAMSWTSVTVSSASATSATATVSNADLDANSYSVRIRTTNNAGFTSPWFMPGQHRHLPHSFRWADNTPQYNGAIGRVFMMVGPFSEDGQQLGQTNDGQSSATCGPNGVGINCPPYTLVSLDRDSNWDNELSFAFRVDDPFHGTYRGEDNRFEIGGPGGMPYLVVSGGNGSLSAAWKRVHSVGRAGSAVVGYKVEYRRDVESDYTVEIVPGADARAHTITGLLNGATYHVRVRAFNNAGGQACAPDSDGVYPDAMCHDGWSSTPRLERLDGSQSGTPGAPTSGAVTVGNQKLTVSWGAPSSDGGATVHAYSVRHKLSTDDDSMYVTRTVWSRTRSIVIDGLTNASAYVVQIQAHNANGTSAWTTIGTTHTPTM